MKAHWRLIANYFLETKKLLLVIFLVQISTYTYSQSEIINAELIEFKSLFNSKMRDSVSCYRIPSIVTALNGDLISAIDERKPSCGDLKWNKDINIVIRRSMDNGNSWSEIETVVDYPFGKSASDPSMIVDRVTGEIFLFFNFMDHEAEKDVYYLKVIKSSDHGKTWSFPVDITSQITKPEWFKDFKFITSGGGTQTRSGKLLHTLVNLQKGLFVFSSSDHGKSWQLIDTPIAPADESKIVELEDGTWMINSRVNNKGFRYVHTSSNEGVSWLSKPDSSLIDPGCNGSIIRYSSKKDGADKNRLLFSNAKMKDQRMNLTVRISYDEGNRWSEGKTIYAGSSAYSSLCILANGDIGLFFEKDNYTENVFVRFNLEWLTNGKDKYVKAK
ncbi:MAG: sialidase family protein [Bacteroidota bacterium]